MRKAIRNFVQEGSRVAWTAVEAAAGFLAAYNVPKDLLGFLGPYEPVAVAALGIAIASLAAKLKEVSRLKHEHPDES